MGVEFGAEFVPKSHLPRKRETNVNTVDVIVETMSHAGLKQFSSRTAIHPAWVMTTFYVVGQVICFYIKLRDKRLHEQSLLDMAS